MDTDASVDIARLQQWIVDQRWFASKGRQVDIALAAAVPLSEVPPLTLALVEARDGTGVIEQYQLLMRGPDGPSLDALDDPAARTALVELLLDGQPVGSDGGTVTFHWDAPDLRRELHGAEVRRMGVEQSNSSLLIADRVVLKLFRRLEGGLNPELEMLSFLSAHGFTSAPRLTGWIDLRSEGFDATLAVAQSFVADGRDGWDLTLDALADGDAGTESLHQLGETVGSMHRVLASDSGDPAFAPEQPSERWAADLAASLDQRTQEVFGSLPDVPALRPLRGRVEAVRSLVDTLTQQPGGGRLIRTHGDLHLGQVLRRPDSWVILDFEGEPAAPLADRRRKRSALRDVAGMLRSFAYATLAVRLQRSALPPADWEQEARDSFLAGYLGAIAPILLPGGRAEIDQLLAVFELEKALYELGYEVQSRPDWVEIPVAGIVRLLEEHTP